MARIWPDETIGGEWFSTIWVNDHTERIDFYGEPKRGLRIDIPPNTFLDQEAVHKLWLALARYERWKTMQ